MQLMFFFGAFPPAPRVENHHFPYETSEPNICEARTCYLYVYIYIFALLGSIVIPQTLHAISFKRIKKT